MKLRRFVDISEGIRDKMTPISSEKIEKAVKRMEKLTPYGMSLRIDEIEYDWDDKYGELKKVLKISDLRKKSNNRIKESLAELDGIFAEMSENDDLKKLIPKVKDWIHKYGGNEDNIDDYGYTKMAEKIWYCGVQWQHDTVIIYDDTVFVSFRELLKNVAICEAKYNNKDVEHY